MQKLIVAYHNELLACLGAYSGLDRRIDFGWLYNAVAQLGEASKASGDSDLWEILDDMQYAMNETYMGAESKGRSVLPELRNKIAAYTMKADD